MYNLEQASIIENLRRQDEIKAAEHERLIKEITRQRSPEYRWHGRLLARLGTKLVAWGYRLQSRYDEILVPSVNPNVPDNRMTPC